MCIFDHKKHAYKSELLALGEGYGNYVLMVHPHEGISASRRKPGEI